jgi:hypothetical protein
MDNPLRTLLKIIGRAFYATGIAGIIYWTVVVPVSASFTGNPFYVQAVLGAFVAGWSPDVGNNGSVSAYHNAIGGTPNALNILSGIEANTAALIPNIGVGPSHWTSTSVTALSSGATLLVPALPGSPGVGSVRVGLMNVGSEPVTIGPTNSITAGAGMTLPATMSAPIFFITTAAIYGIASTSTSAVQITQEY